MLFKGTRSRTAQHIAREMDSIGGNLDAFTGKETICFNVKSLADHVPIALDVLTDLVLNPVFADNDIERERGVILEEIKIDEDNPDVLVHELFTQSFWKDHPLGMADSGHDGDGDPAGPEEPVRLPQRPFSWRQHGVFCGRAIWITTSLWRRWRPSFPGWPAARRCTNCQRRRRARRIVHAQQAVAGAGADLPGRAGAADYRRKPLCHADSEYGAGRRDELAAVPDDSRGAGDGVLDLLAT